MSFVVGVEEAAGAAVARTAAEQAARLKAECAAAGEAAAFVHKARVRCKKVRAALRLARGVMGEKAFRRENGWWRDAARGLSEVRDAGVRVGALAGMAAELEAEIGTAAVRRVARRFGRRDGGAAGNQAGDAATDAATDTAAAAIAAFRAAAADHEIDLPDLSHATVDDLIDGLATGYAAARAAMKDAFHEGSPDLFHEWRKQVKYHALQARLMRRLIPALEARVAAARDLAERLGAVQDIEVVLEGLADWPAAPHRLAPFLEARREGLMADARGLGESLFSAKRRDWITELTI